MQTFKMFYKEFVMALSDQQLALDPTCLQDKNLLLSLTEKQKNFLCEAVISLLANNYLPLLVEQDPNGLMPTTFKYDSQVLSLSLFCPILCGLVVLIRRECSLGRCIGMPGGIFYICNSGFGAHITPDMIRQRSQPLQSRSLSRECRRRVVEF